MLCKMMMSNFLSLFSKNKRILLLIIFHLAIVILIFFLIFIKFPCPFKFVFGIPCPACGTLHALRSIIKLDFAGYLENNYLAVPLVLAFWLGMHKKSIFKGSKIIDLFIYIICFLDIIRYVSKIFVDFL